jgi:hypothetical protein
MMQDALMGPLGFHWEDASTVPFAEYEPLEVKL